MSASCKRPVVNTVERTVSMYDSLSAISNLSSLKHNRQTARQMIELNQKYSVCCATWIRWRVVFLPQQWGQPTVTHVLKFITQKRFWPENRPCELGVQVAAVQVPFLSVLLVPNMQPVWLPAWQHSIWVEKLRSLIAQNVCFYQRHLWLQCSLCMNAYIQWEHGTGDDSIWYMDWFGAPGLRS